MAQASLVTAGPEFPATAAILETSDQAGYLVTVASLVLVGTVDLVSLAILDSVVIVA